MALRTQSIDILLDTQDPAYGPVYITVNVVPAKRVFDTDLHVAPIRHRLKPTSVLLEHTNGTVTHKVEVDGAVNICLRAGLATAEKPLRFGWRIQLSEADPIPSSAADAASVDRHLSHMELELKRIQVGMHHIIKQADFAKEREAVFHQNTLRMHAAATFWPIVQVCVLIITGFTQASHIVRFFKSRRII
jgi:hypothetical protein